MEISQARARASSPLLALPAELRNEITILLLPPDIDLSAADLCAVFRRYLCPLGHANRQLRAESLSLLLSSLNLSFPEYFYFFGPLQVKDGWNYKFQSPSRAARKEMVMASRTAEGTQFKLGVQMTPPSLNKFLRTVEFTIALPYECEATLMSEEEGRKALREEWLRPVRMFFTTGKPENLEFLGVYFRPAMHLVVTRAQWSKLKFWERRNRSAREIVEMFAVEEILDLWLESEELDVVVSGSKGEMRTTISVSTREA